MVRPVTCPQCSGQGLDLDARGDISRICEACDGSGKILAPEIKIMPTDNPNIDHPSHYGGKDNPYEAIKVIEAWKLGFNLGNTLKYISRAGKKDVEVQDLEKALWYLEQEIANKKAMSHGES